MEQCVIRKRSHTRKKLPKRWRLLTVLIAVAVAITLIVTLVNAGVYPVMIALSEARIRSLAITALHDAITESISDETKYAEMLECRDNGQRIYMLQADTIAMNGLAAEATTRAQDILSEIGEQGVSVAIGTITGIPLLSGIGPKVKILFTPAASVKSEFQSTLASSGINQSLYRVNIVLTANVYIILPGVSHLVSATASAAIAESVIIGDVPQVYTDVAGEEDMLNLIPTDPVE